VSSRRWWASGERSIEAEAEWFEQDGLAFTLDDGLFQANEVVVFRGELRLGEQRCTASVIYPPSYGADGHPSVLAPDLPVGRHRSPDGHLCLDHPVFGKTQPMCGAEAVNRAERLWDLWENDRETLRVEEADAPDPAANYYPYKPDSSVAMVHADIADGQRGYFELAAESSDPLRGAVTRIRVTHPGPATIVPPEGIRALAGPVELTGAWIRIPTRPPFLMPELLAWVEENHRRFLDRQLKYATEQGKASGRPDTPALAAFVFPDEGPGRGETHDGWLFMAIDPVTGRWHLARSFHLRSDERWLRQPQLVGLAGKHVALVGVGALGSQIAGTLARAGVGRLLLLDYDIVTHGNRVRHELDLTALGRAKVTALAERLSAINPWSEISVSHYRLGGASSGVLEGASQRHEDDVFARLQQADLIVNASADSVTGKYVSGLSVDADTPVLHAWVTAGAWGARLLIQRPGRSGCWNCLASFQETEPPDGDPPVVPPVSSDPEVGEVSERGCADPSFTGPGFELTAAASAASRIAVQLLLQDADGYPPADFDLATVNFRDELRAVPSAQYSLLPVHPQCPFCNPAMP
jgi:hypothetical protein